NREIIPIPWKSLEVTLKHVKRRIKRKDLMDAQPRDFRIMKDANNLLLTWLHPNKHTKLIKFFYVNVRSTISSTSHSNEYFLLNVTGIIMKAKSFNFRCMNLSEKFKDVKAKIWSLPEPADKSGSLFQLNKRAIQNPVQSSLSLDEDAQESRKREYQCCKELVDIRLLKFNHSALQVIVMLHTLPNDSHVTVSLMNVTTTKTGDVNLLKTWNVYGNGGEKNESLSYGVPSPGKYKSTVLKHCRETRYTIDSTDCKPVKTESNTVAVDKSFNESPEAAKQRAMNSNRDDDMSDVLKLSGLTMGILLGVFGVTFVIMICIANIFKTKDSKRHCNPEQGNGEQNVALLEAAVEEETVAIIYMRDSREYDKAVDIFEKMLNDLEVKAQTIRLDSTKLMNIIDFSETVCRSFKRFIIIISPDLYHLCHSFKNGDNTMYERILTKHCGLCLPVVLLNYLNQICFYGRENVPVYLVQFFEYGRLGCDYMNMFVSDHLVLSTRFRHCLYRLDDNGELQLEEDTLKALVRHLHSTSMPTIANGRNVDIRLKTKVKCELKDCAKALISLLKMT
ncbi:hypothetical protein ACJMK2_016242, partial [Sinanodonta woodiana]